MTVSISPVGRRRVLLVLLMMLPVLLAVPYERPPARPFFWADREVNRHKVRQVTDRIVLSVPTGYVFASRSMTLDDVRPVFTVIEEGLRFGSACHIRSHEEWRGNGARTFEGRCERITWAPWELLRFETRLIAGERACGFTAPQLKSDGRAGQRWLLCREDGCWDFWVRSAEGSNQVPGELVGVLDTMRFVPLPESEPDFVLRGR